MTTTDSIALTVKIARIRAGLRQCDVAEKADITKLYLGKIENGRAPNVSLVIMARLAGVLGFSLDQFIGCGGQSTMEKMDG